MRLPFPVAQATSVNSTAAIIPIRIDLIMIFLQENVVLSQRRSPRAAMSARAAPPEAMVEPLLRKAPDLVLFSSGAEYWLFVVDLSPDIRSKNEMSAMMEPIAPTGLAAAATKRCPRC